MRNSELGIVGAREQSGSLKRDARAWARLPDEKEISNFEFIGARRRPSRLAPDARDRARRTGRTLQSKESVAKKGLATYQ